MCFNLFLMARAIIGSGLKNKVDWLAKRQRGLLGDRMGIRYRVFKRNLVEAMMPVDKRTKQPFGILHGGASVALAESLASVGGWLNVDEDKYRVVGIEINANHLRAKSEGFVIGQARPLHVGRRTQVWEIKIRDRNKKLVCVSRCTLAVVERGAI